MAILNSIVWPWTPDPSGLAWPEGSGVQTIYSIASYTYGYVLYSIASYTYGYVLYNIASYTYGYVLYSIASYSSFTCMAPTANLAVSTGQIQLLYQSNGEGSGFSSSRLSLCNYISTPAARHNGSLLDGRRLFIPKCIDAAQKPFAQPHVVKCCPHLRFPIFCNLLVGLGF